MLHKLADYRQRACTPRWVNLSRGSMAIACAIALSMPASVGAQVTGEINAHDPSSIIKVGSTYYYYATGDYLVSRTSTDRVNWTAGPAVFNSVPSWVPGAVPGFGTSFWAPDIIYRNNQYYLYYSASIFGTKLSAIGLATSPTLDTTAPNYGWTDQGPILQSNHGSNYNAIDPAILQDSTTGRLWMTYGSFNAGIFVRELNSTTGKFLPGAAVNVAAPPAPNPEIEGASLVQHGGYYYLFANWGGCCNGIDSTYNIRVGRSTSPTGPFVDKNGVNLLNGGGSLFYDDDGARTGPGHFSIFSEGGQDQFSYHYYDGNRSGAPAFGLSNLYWTADAWPSVAAINPDWSGASTASWNTAANWSGGTIPNGVGQIANFVTASSGRYAVAINGGGKTLSRINFASNASYTIGSTTSVNGITLDAMAGDVQTTINVSAGNHAIDAPIVALDDLGVNVTPVGNTLTLGGGVTGKSLIKYGRGTLALGGTHAYTGSVAVHAGTLTIDGPVSATAFSSVGQIVGDVGVMTIRNTGSFSVSADLNIGDSGDTLTAAIGTLNLSGSAQLTVGATGGLYVGSGFFAGSRAVGTVNQSGGTVIAGGNFDGAFVIGGRGSALATGTYNLSGGTVNANTNTFVGGRGTGTINQTGGAFNATAFLSIGRFAGSTGAWNVSAGAINQSNASTLLIVGEAGAGSLTIGGSGQVTSAGGVRLGFSGGSGTVNLNAGGTLTTPTVQRGTGAASFNFDGGTLRASATSANFFQLTAADSEIKAGGARIDTNNRNITIANTLDGVGGVTKVGAGTLTLSLDQAFTGGVTVEAGTLRMRRLANNGVVTLTAGRLELIAPPTAFDPSRRSTAAALNLNGGTLDLTLNLLVIDHAPAQPSPAAAIRAALAAGQIVATGKAANQSIGYADAATLGTIPAAFGTVDLSAVLIRATLAGDTDLNAVVNFDDLLALARNYDPSGSTVRTWQQGDFDYNARVDFDDLLALARNYGTNLSAAEATLLASESATLAADWAASQSLVPEPTVGVALLSLCAGIGVRRRALVARSA